MPPDKEAYPDRLLPIGIAEDGEMLAACTRHRDDGSRDVTLHKGEIVDVPDPAIDAFELGGVTPQGEFRCRERLATTEGSNTSVGSTRSFSDGWNRLFGDNDHMVPGPKEIN